MGRHLSEGFLINLCPLMDTGKQNMKRVLSNTDRQEHIYENVGCIWTGIGSKRVVAERGHAEGAITPNIETSQGYKSGQRDTTSLCLETEEAPTVRHIGCLAAEEGMYHITNETPIENFELPLSLDD